MSDKIDHIEARYVLRLKEVNRLAFLLREDGDQYICTSDLGFARALYVEYSSLQNALEAKSRLRINFCFARHEWRRGINKFGQITAQCFDIGAAGL